MSTPDRSIIGSFGFLVLETTDLPHRSRSDITEFSMVACTPTDLINCEDNIDAPRVSHKLSMCFNPINWIVPEATEKSGFTNAMLANQNRFDENAANVIKHFIEHLPKPLCLVAHNGNRFHYPILKRQLLDLGVILPDDVLCIDSLNAFRNLDNYLNYSKIEKKQPKLPAAHRKRPLTSYKLQDIYERVVKKAKYKDPAETEPLKVYKNLKIASTYRELFEEYALENAKRFSEIKM